MKSTMKGLSHSLSSKSLLHMKSNRMLHNFKVTLLCGILTLLVLRGTVGRTGRVAPPPTEGAMRSRATSRAKLEVAVEGATSEVAKSEDVAVEAAKFEEEATKVEYWDPAVPFHLGPKITGWDEQRLQWNRNHPGANATLSSKPKVLLVTGSQPKSCANPVGSFQLLKSLKNKVDYCRLHDIELFYNMAHLDQHMTSFWAKLPLLRKMMLTHPEVEWLWWMDSDALFTDMTVEVPFQTYENYNLVLNGNEHDVYQKKSWLGMNAGIFLIRNCQWSLDLFDVWAQMGPEGPMRWEAGKRLVAALSDRPEFEADDQSALVHLLSSERERWGGKVFLESNVGLHGYWAMIVEKYEDMMEKGKAGGDRWPFVTHFVGCKPCGKDGSGTYAVDRCLKQMDRAFNFADNQILGLYGFGHATLNTHAVERVRMESSDPLGLIHGST